MKIQNFKIFVPALIAALVTYSPGFALQKTNFEMAVIDVNVLEENQKTKVFKKRN